MKKILLFVVASLFSIRSFAQNWSLSGNSGTNSAIHFIGTTDNHPLVFRQNGYFAGILDSARYNTAFGLYSLNLYQPTFTGIYNTAFGSQALRNVTTGSSNTGIGLNALGYNTTGGFNTAVGHGANGINYTGNYSTSIGYASMGNSTGGDYNTAIGYGSLGNNVNGSGNAALGANAGGMATNYGIFIGDSAYGAGNGGNYNIAIGYNAYKNGYFSSSNIAIGDQAMYNANNVSYYNTAINYQSLYNVTTGSFNFAAGYQSQYSNTTGSHNISSGYLSLYSNTTGSNNIALGSNAGYNATGSNNTAIGANTNLVSATASNQLNIANAIFGTGLTGSVTNPTGNIGIGTSSPQATFEVNSNTTGTSGLRLTKLVSTNGIQPIGVDANGNVVAAGAVTNTNWSLTGNSGLTADNYIGASDNSPVSIRQNNTNIFQGLPNNNIGVGNSFYGIDYQGGNNKSSDNLAFGLGSLQTSNNMYQNIGLGRSSFYDGATDSNSIAIGFAAWQSAHLINRSTVMGYNSGNSGSNLNDVIIVGNNSGLNAGNISNGIVFGNNASLIGSNSLNISNVLFGTGLISTSYGSPAGNLGIGTSTPSTKLEVTSDNANTSGLKLTNLTSASPAATGTVQPIGVDASGNVVTAPGTNGNYLPLTGGALTGNLNVAANMQSLRYFNITLTGSNSRNSFQSFNTNETTISSGWVAADFGGNGTEDRVVLGSGHTGQAVLGAHNHLLNSWSNLLINPDGGNVGIGITVPPNEKLVVNGNVRSTRFYNSFLSGSNGYLSKNSFQSFNTNETSLTPGWVAADFGGNGTEDRVVLGSGFGGKAILAGHKSGLDGWSDLSINPGGGNVGIGTAAPSTKLEVASGIANTSGLKLTNLTSASPTATGTVQPIGVDASGNVVAVAGGNTAAVNNYMPSYQGSVSAATMTNTFNLPVNTAYRPDGTATLDMITPDGGAGGGFGVLEAPFISSPVVWLYDNHHNAFTVAVKHYTDPQVANPMTVAGDHMEPALQVRETGRVLIKKTSAYFSDNTVTTDYLLDVAGNVRANQVTVNTTGADFVFEPSYKLEPLSELKSYVEKNKHLPGIAPAAEMQKNGTEVGESQTKLLQKVEELTLYIILQDKKITEQEGMIKAQKAEMVAKAMVQEARITEMEQKLQQLLKPSQTEKQ